MKLVKCKSCGSPIALRSTGIDDAFTPQADRLRRKYRGKLKPCTSESSEKQLCGECLGVGQKKRDNKE